MRVLIDTNIFLNFYRMSDQSLTSLDSLLGLIKTKKIELILPKQIRDEFFRDKSIVSKDFIFGLEKNLDIRTPLFLKSYKKVKDLSSLVSKLEKIKKDIIIENNKRISNPKSKINTKIKKVFDLALKPDESEALLQKAYFRTLRGNPPRKNNKSFGDAIIWETVIDRYIDEDITIISNDGDFESETVKENINEFLENEWKQKSTKSIKLYCNFGTFINDISGKKKPVRKEIIEEENRLNLATSNGPFSKISTGAIDSNVFKFQEIYNTGDMLTFPSVSAGISFNQITCSCCGEKYTYDGSILLNNSRCSKCQDVFSVAKKCDKCGKHYHESYNSVLSFSVYGGNRCKDCVNKP